MTSEELEPAFLLTWRDGQYRVNKPNVDGRVECFTREQVEALASALAAAEAREAEVRNGLENCRLYAAKHRDWGWARHILRFCIDAGVTGSPLKTDALAAKEGA